MVKELAKKYRGIACEENYHDNYPGVLETKEFPCLTYTRDLEDWHDFIRRTPREYKDWIDGVREECEILELRMLPEIYSAAIHRCLIILAGIRIKRVRWQLKQSNPS